MSPPSQSDSSKPNTLELSGWITSNPCGHLTTNWAVTKIKILSHKMLAIEFCSICRHHAVKVSIKCRICEQFFWRTYDFNSSGKHANSGLYRKHMAIIKWSNISMAYNTVEDCFKAIKGHNEDDIGDGLLDTTPGSIDQQQK
ncbi:hypothetical protein niasHT_005740 [Heterodera trifolii]|uniref:Uncharacterized protein n=1 Tax=Heterodera trifolii TaxID=157864 RepID=A0ABD2LYW8_9BILA